MEKASMDISKIVKQYQSKWSPSMQADYCWALKRKVPQAKYSRKSTEVTHLIITRSRVLVWKYTFLLQYNCMSGHAEAQVVETLRYKPEGPRFDSKWSQ